MNKETWVRRVTEELRKHLGAEYHLELETGEKGDFIRIRKEGDLTGISLDLSVCEPAWLYHEEKIGEAASFLEKVYQTRYEVLKRAVMSGEDFESVKHMVVYVLEKRSGNEEALSEIPYEEFFDWILIFELHLHRASESYHRVINNEDMKQWGINKQELLEAARQNTPVLYPPVIGLFEPEANWKEESGPEPMEIPELVSKMKDKESTRLFILTEVNGRYGAVCMFYEGVLKQIAEACQDNLVLLPTSCSEVLLFPNQRDCWRVEEWLKIVSKMEWARGFGDWSFLDSFYLYDRREDIIKLIKKGWNQAEILAS